MPNIKSAKKRVRVNEQKMKQGQMRVSAMKTAIKKYDTALESGDKKLIEETYRTAVRLVDQEAARGSMKKNTAARRKSLLTRKLNAQSSAPKAEVKEVKKAKAPAAVAEVKEEAAPKAPAKKAAAPKAAEKKPAAKATAAKKPAADKAKKAEDK